ncbi:MAG: aspartate--tRNA ligase, partial [Promethearchaeota archaeon]
FKQLLMVAGLQKYFQITRCFRDEDLRNDRQPEFTQLDIEMSFITQEDIISLIEEYLVYIFETVLDVKIERPFPRLTYEEAMGQYGTDKPDIRFDLKLVDITDLIPEDTEIFKDVFAEGGIISALKVEGYGDISRKKFEKYRRYVRIFKAQDVGNILLRENEIKTPLGRYVGDSVIDAIVERTEAKQGDLICFIGGEKSIVYRALGELRLKIAEDLDLIPENEFKFLWVVDFPLFEWDEDENRWTAMHHPFTSCKKEYLDIFDENPGDALANAYDVVLNGYELGGGSIRNHHPDIQERMFKALDIPPEIAKSNFSFLIEALKYGAPPHGGIALGFDRLIMLMVQEETLRDVIAFPKNRNAILPVGNAPDRVTNEQLDTLGIDLTPEVRAQLEKEEENDS